MRKQNKSRSFIAGILSLATLLSMLPTALLPTAFAAQTSDYHDPAKGWLQSSNRTVEFDVNSVIRQETFLCHVCDKDTMFTIYRVPEYTRSGQTARNNNVSYSDGTSDDGTQKGNVDTGLPGSDSIYTGYHWAKAVCNTCGTINGNFDQIRYGHNKNVYYLYDCAGNFTEEFELSSEIEQVDDTYHKHMTENGKYCGFCYGTRSTVASSLERHNFDTKILPQPAHGRFAVVDTCKDCGYTKNSYVAAKSVVADYYGPVDGASHTLSLTDLSESSVRTIIRYGDTAESCTLTTAPNYNEEGQYRVFYDITYNYQGVEMDENGVAYVWLHNKNAAVNPGSGGTGGTGSSCACGCQDVNCGCQNPSCGGNCCVDKGCGDNHKFTLLESIKPTCMTLGYDRYLCVTCGKVEKRDYEAALGHDMQSMEVHPATCEENGISLEICSRCGKTEKKLTPKGEHKWQTSNVPATCISSGYTLKECSVCHERHITNITEALPHNYEQVETPATCLTSGQILHVCNGCGSSFTTDYKEALGHDWDEGTVIHDASCTEEGLIEYRCKRCDVTRIEGGSTGNNHGGISHDVITSNGVLSGSSTSGHIPGAAATCTTPQICTHCGIILASATGHSFASVTTAPTCLTMGYTTHTCTKCAYSYKSDYVDSLNHSWDSGKTVVNSTCNGKGMKEYTCTRCDAHYTESESAAGHTPGAAATCTEPQVCTACGAVLAKPTGHTIKSTVTAPTCATIGFTTNACQNCNFEYTDKLIDQLGHRYVEKVTAPTCTEQGFTTYTCDRCKDTYVSDYKAALDHKWSEGKVIVNSTCNGKGMTQYDCQRCDATRVESESAEGHTPGAAATCTEPQLCTVCKAVLAKPTGHNLKSEKTAPACTTIGYTTHSCKTCDYSYKDEYVDALGHNYKDTVKAPTCLKQGYTTHTCERCKDNFVTDYKDPTGHKWDSGTVVVNPTCTSSGMTEYRCENCDAIQLESKAETGHTPGAAATCTEAQVCKTCGVVLAKPTGHTIKSTVTAPTCTTIGFTANACQNCNFEYMDKLIDQLGHHYAAKVTAPTCTEQGFTTYTCDRCKDTYVSDYKDALDHKWSEGKVVVNSTCNGKGMTQYDCERCDAIRIESESAEGHTPGVAATCTEPQLCMVCKAVLAKPTGHNFKSKKTAPTCTTIGYTTHTCKTCGYSYKDEYVDALGHNYKDTVTAPTCLKQGYTTHTCERCKDSFITDYKDPTGHKWDNGTVVVNSTCNGKGMTQYKCENCEDTRLESEDATGHTPGAAATCTEPQVCTTCGAVINKAFGHNFVDKVTVPTCLEGGCTTHACERCDASFVTDYKDALGHNWDDGTVVVNSTCNGKGMIEYQCNHCGTHRIESEDATGHTPGEPATCTEPKLCTVCNAVLEKATGHQFTDKVTAPTCLEGGYTTHSCDICGEGFVTDYTDPTGHDWDEGTLLHNATCTGEGLKEYHCKNCDEKRYENNAANGHFPGEPATCTEPQTCTKCGAIIVKAAGHNFKPEVTEPTCTTMGFTNYVCENCGLEYQSKYTQPLGHCFTETVTEPACLDQGFTTHVCDHCGLTYVDEYTDALGHDWDNGTTFVGATCNGEGMKEYRCRRCDYHRMESESPEGHTPGKPATCLDPQVCTVCGAVLEKATGHSMKTEVTPATCLEMGYTTYSCENCDFSYKSDYTKPLGHNHVPTVTDPTCLEKGFTTYTCDRCEDSYVADYTDALGHEWDEGTPVTSATCKGEGVVDHRCVRCDYHRLQAASAEGHTPGAEATCTTPQLCTECGAVLVQELGHDYKSEVTEPTCLAMGFTTNTCTRCEDTFQTSYTDATGHTLSDWIIDQEATFDGAGSRHKECTVCGETLETEVLTKLYLTAITDNHGEAIVGDYTILVTDTDTFDPVIGAAVTLDKNGKLSVRLPDGRLIDYADLTTVTVQLTKDKTVVPGMDVSVTDKNANHCAGQTNKQGQLTVPSTSGQTSENGNNTSGREDENGTRWTLNVKVIDTTTNRPIEGAKVEISKPGTVTITLPDGTNIDATHRVQIIVTDQNQKPQSNVTVVVKNDQGKTEQGQTNKDGILTLPVITSAYTDDKGNAILGQYTVIVSDSEKQPVSKALVTLNLGTEGAKDSFTIQLPDGRLLDANAKTTVTVLLPTGKGASGLNVKVRDSKNNQSAKATDYNGVIIVPEGSGSSDNTVGTGTVDKDENTTVNVTVNNQDGKPIKKADISVDKKGNITINLPKDFTFEKDGSVYVTVTDNKGNPKPDASVSVKDGSDETADGRTDEDGKITLPGIVNEHHAAYVEGYEDGNFLPGKGMTRAEAATIFARLLAEKNGDSIPRTAKTIFADIPAKAWYSGYVKYLTGYDVLYGRGDDIYAPREAITRAEFIAMASRFFDAYGIDGELLDDFAKFNDVPDVHWASAYIKDAAAHGWIEGYDDGTFRANRSISRAEVVTIVNRVLNRIADEDYIKGNIRKLNTFPDVRKNHWAYNDVTEAANAHGATITRNIETWKGKE